MLNTSNSTAMDIGIHDDNSGFTDFDSYYDLNYLSNASYPGDEDLFSGLCEAGEHELTIKMFQTCVFCLVFVLGVVGNCLVIGTFARYRCRWLRSMTDVFLFHLALADLLLLLTLPFQAVDTNKGWIFPGFICKATRACYAVNTYSGLLLLACISVDRYLVVARAQEMLRLRSQILTGGKMAAVAVWAIAVLLSLPEILFSGVSQGDSNLYCGVIKSGRVKMVTNGAIIAVFCVSLSVMVACYSLIARVLWEGHAHRRGKQWHRQRTLKLMVALVLVFLLFQLPYTVVLSRKMAAPVVCSLLLEYTTSTLAYTRCCLNPILYALVGVRFRKDVARLLHDLGCRGALRLLASWAPKRSYSSSEVTPSTRFQFPENK